MTDQFKLFFATWQSLTGYLAFSAFTSGDSSGGWYWVVMFLTLPVTILGFFIFSITPAGKDLAKRRLREKEQADALRRQTGTKSVIEQSLLRSLGQPAPGPSQVINAEGKKPGKLLHPTPENFEEYCTSWCSYLGYKDAVKTQNSRDGGIDIRSPKMIAQVKFQVSPVGVKAIRELNGVRKPDQEVLFFSLNGYTPEARREAAEMNITLIRVSPLEGQIDILA
jgi:hypothetical protein